MVKLRALAVIVLVLFIISGVLGVQAQGGGTLRVGMVAPQVLDPALGSNDPEVLLNRSVYDYLIEVLPDKTLAPNLATEWTVSDDSLSYTFKLQQGVTFHDGSPLTSADVAYTFNRLKDVKSPALNLLGEYEVSTPDAQTVVFTLPQPNADFLYGVADRFTLILKDGADGTDWNGSGPFVMQDYKEGERATLIRYDKYWKPGEPKLDQLEFVFINDPVTQVDALRSGQVDFIFKISTEQIATLEGESDFNVLQKTTNQHPVIRLRTDTGPGQDERVRKAFKMATDRDYLNESVLDGRGVIGNNNPIGPGFGAYYADNIEEPAYDPQAACELLKEAGYPDGLTMTLNTIKTLDYTKLATVLQQEWSKACINVEIQENDENLYYSDNYPNNWMVVELGITGWGDRPVPQGYLTQAYVTGGIYNETRWSDPELDKLVADAGVTTDQTKRADIYHQIAQIFADRGPIIVPWFAPIFGATRANVQGLDMAPFPGLTDLRTVSVSG